MASRSDRWDRERFQYERDRDRYGDERERYRFEDDERERFQRRPSPPRFREDFGRRPPVYDDDRVRDRRFYEGDEVRFERRRYSPPTRHPLDREDFDRHVVIEKGRRPTMVRRQSSLDTFDRFPRGYHEREEYGPPARREDYRPQPYMPIPLPRTRALPPPRRYEHYDEIKVSDPDYYGDEEYRNYPERMHEREMVRMRRRDRSRERSRARSRRSSSRSSSTSSSSNSSVTTTKTATTVKSEYPKKGKTRIPSRLVSKRAIIDLGYPYEEEGNTIIIQRALGQENIDDLLKLSEDYKQSELEVVSARSEHAEVVEETVVKEEVVVAPPAPPPPPPPPPAPAEPVIVDVPPPAPPPPAEAPAPVINTTTTMVAVRDVSPSRMTTSSYCTSDSSYSTHTRVPVIVDAGPREMVRHRRHRSASRGDLVRAERLSDGQLVIYEERVEKIEEPRRGVRIEKDKKGPPPKLLRAMLATLT
ncbi:hypothetical protein MCOR27_007360 [Pyricularia oryzae]|uniref:DUF8035 domain-containing protein n=4 Tax=Pyricularia oryzae TaxID=318829 RepID=G4NA00_PYRO7|nr:uncharacterized protein MGG_09779 [Pyricularia oryzae 70-15]ELQ41790.1 hypothetical protein OOU_Y34scaffold00254g8 [Pyricularia oryzae Y34]KAH8843020.1 hypothetical protein MCOR01_003850 [Pyricularia oryzae]EHA51247.1 hypothetical protein MGG_09779 [Pyricularia oryzae 70-15]KAH9427375.1 hypothetical protein MCOR02_012280 [Pyricularia oryzae]KAI6255875.1 hypothetical protein MCOR19_007677 [Pyricularia oryzae]